MKILSFDPRFIISSLLTLSTVGGCKIQNSSTEGGFVRPDNNTQASYIYDLEENSKGSAFDLALRTTGETIPEGQKFVEKAGGMIFETLPISIPNGYDIDLDIRVDHDIVPLITFNEERGEWSTKTGPMEVRIFKGSESQSLRKEQKDLGKNHSGTDKFKISDGFQGGSYRVQIKYLDSRVRIRSVQVDANWKNNSPIVDEWNPDLKTSDLDGEIAFSSEGLWKCDQDDHTIKNCRLAKSQIELIPQETRQVLDVHDLKTKGGNGTPTKVFTPAYNMRAMLDCVVDNNGAKWDEKSPIEIKNGNGHDEYLRFTDTDLAIYLEGSSPVYLNLTNRSKLNSLMFGKTKPCKLDIRYTKVPGNGQVSHWSTLISSLRTEYLATKEKYDGYSLIYTSVQNPDPS